MATGFVDVTSGKTAIGTQYQKRGGLFYGSSLDGIAAAGNNQGTATLLLNSQNRITTVPSGSGVRLPPAQPGLNITVVHAAITNALLVYGSGSDTINGAASYSITAAAAGVGKVVTFYAFSAGAWHALLSS